MRGKDYYNFFQECKTTEPTAVKRWYSLYPGNRQSVLFINRRILAINKKLKKFKIRNDDLCAQGKNPDSLEFTFLLCPTNVKFYHKILSWFNVSHNTSINLSPEQILLQKSIPGPINDNLRRRLDLLLLFIKKYVYSLKINKMPITCTQFINNLKIQLEMESLPLIALSRVIRLMMYLYKL